MLSEWERAEADRSAAEAAHLDVANLLADESRLQRYVHPPSDTCYPLEYSYHLLGDVRGKTVLEYGCGDGMNTVVLVRRGARVKALDLSPDLIKVARRRLVANHISAGVEFIIGSAHDLPLRNDSVDVLFGIAILHHLDLAISAREVRRVLHKGGRAIFQEPIRNSKVLRFLRSLIPYQAQDVSPFERPLTDEELETYADEFSSYHTKAFTLPTTRLVNVLPPLRRRFNHTCCRMDAAILRNLPSVAYYATVRVIELVK
jgi:SAM-dependent methyltransferase